MELSLSKAIYDSEVRTRSGRHLACLVVFLLLLSLALTDVAVVAWLATVASAVEILADGLAFALVSWGAIITVWKLDR